LQDISCDMLWECKYRVGHSGLTLVRALNAFLSRDLWPTLHMQPTYGKATSYNCTITSYRTSTRNIMFGLVVFPYFPQKTCVHIFLTLVNENTELGLWLCISIILLAESLYIRQTVNIWPF
jgi:hypothetical protein